MYGDHAEYLFRCIFEYLTFHLLDERLTHRVLQAVSIGTDKLQHVLVTKDLFCLGRNLSQHCRNFWLVKHRALKQRTADLAVKFTFGIMLIYGLPEIELSLFFRMTTADYQ